MGRGLEVGTQIRAAGRLHRRITNSLQFYFSFLALYLSVTSRRGAGRENLKVKVWGFPQSGMGSENRWMSLDDETHFFPGEVRRTAQLKGYANKKLSELGWGVWLGGEIDVDFTLIHRPPGERVWSFPASCKWTEQCGTFPSKVQDENRWHAVCFFPWSYVRTVSQRWFRQASFHHPDIKDCRYLLACCAFNAYDPIEVLWLKTYAAKCWVGQKRRRDSIFRAWNLKLLVSKLAKWGWRRCTVTMTE